MTTSDGKVWNVDSKYKWKFFFDDDTEMEFWIENPKALQQDDKEVELGMDDYENKEAIQRSNSRSVKQCS